MLGPELFCRVLGIDASAEFPWSEGQEKFLVAGKGECMCCGREDEGRWLHRRALESFTEFFLLADPAGELLCPWCAAAMAAVRTKNPRGTDPMAARLRRLAADTLGRENGFAVMDFAVSEKAGVAAPRSGKLEDRLAFWAGLPSFLDGKGCFAVAASKGLAGGKGQPKHRVPFLRTSLSPGLAHVTLPGAPPLAVDLGVVAAAAEILSGRPKPKGTWTGYHHKGKKEGRAEECLARRLLAGLLEGRPAEVQLLSSAVFGGAKFVSVVEEEERQGKEKVS